MHFFIISQFAGSPDLGMVTRNYNWAIELIKKGHKVTIIAASYSHYRNKHPDMKGKTIKTEIIDGVRYIWVKIPYYDGKSGVGRVKSFIRFNYMLSQFVKRTRQAFDVVIASSPQPLVIYSARKLAVKNRAKLVYDIRDLWPLTLKKLGGMSSYHPLIMILQHAENYACRHADIVTAVPQNAQSYLVDHGMAADKFLHIGNGYLENQATPDHLMDAHKAKIQRIKDQGGFVIGYCGTLGLANALHVAIDSAAITKTKNIHLVLIGDGAYKADLQDKVKNLKLEDRVHFLSPVPHIQIPDFLSLIDVAYIGMLKTDLYKYGASTAKMNDYMAAAKAILYAFDDPNNPVEQSGGGLCCEPENTTDIAKAMDQFSAMDHDAISDMGKKGHEWLMVNQTVSSQIKKLLDRF